MTSQSAKANEQSHLTIARSMSVIDADQWNMLANPQGSLHDPFLQWDFLDALEVSGSVRPETGWAPHHVLIRNTDDVLHGAMPLYVKGHSMGEFVFDHGWADAFERAGGRYYPKLLCAIPFTPITGRRLLIRPGAADPATRTALSRAAISLTSGSDLSSCHINFVTPNDREILERCGFLLRRDRQFHWHNRGYGDFDDFLADLSSRKRKNIRKEREAAQRGLRFERLTGQELTPIIWDRFYQFYVDTYARKWGAAPLTRAFFDLLGQRMADSMILIMAICDDTPVAAALNMIGGDALFGRYWGCASHRRFLHFEVCYYQAIEYAIDRGLARVEGGAQGEHKLARGYQAQPTWSAHWIAHEGLRHAVSRYLGTERRIIADQTRQLQQHAPFRRDSDRNCDNVEE